MLHTHMHTRPHAQWIKLVPKILRDRGFQGLVSMESWGVNDTGLLPQTPDSIGLGWGHKLVPVKVF